MCGNGPVDLSATVNSASGAMSVSCSNSTDCELQLDFIKGLLPKVDLRGCNHGECVDQFASPISAKLTTVYRYGLYRRLLTRLVYQHLP